MTFDIGVCFSSVVVLVLVWFEIIFIFFLDSADKCIYTTYIQIDCIQNLPTTLELTMNKIVLVTYESGVIRWYPYSLETLEALSAECQWIEDIQIIDCAVEKAQYIITKTV